MVPLCNEEPANHRQQLWELYLVPFSLSSSAQSPKSPYIRHLDIRQGPEAQNSAANLPQTLTTHNDKTKGRDLTSRHLLPEEPESLPETLPGLPTPTQQGGPTCPGSKTSALPLLGPNPGKGRSLVLVRNFIF